MFLYSVKFSIKSFRVPELFIEVPETETIGALKVCNSVDTSNTNKKKKKKRNKIKHYDVSNLVSPFILHKPKIGQDYVKVLHLLILQKSVSSLILHFTLELLFFGLLFFSLYPLTPFK